MRLIISILFLGLALNACKTKSSITSFSPKKIQAFYSTLDSTSISYSLRQSSLPETSEHSQFSYFFKVNKRNSLHTFTDYRRTHYIYEDNKLINGSINLPWSYNLNDTLEILLFNHTSTLLSKDLIIVKANDLSCEVLHKNQMSGWDAPYFIVKQFYLIQAQNDSLFYTITPYSFNSATKAEELKRLQMCTSKCQFIPKKVGQLTLYNTSTKDSILNTAPIVGETFPKNNKPEEMLNSLKLIIPNLNVDSLIDNNNGAKMELDKLWLKAADKDEIKAKAAIKSYYNRVETANKLFTTKQSMGMYSDKGKAYILFGKPELNLLSGNKESWYFTKDTTDKSKCINFNIANTLTSGYSIEKDEVYNIRYKQALLHWQKAKVFTLYLQ